MLLLNSSSFLLFSILANDILVWQHIRIHKTILNTLFSNPHPQELVIIPKFLHDSQIHAPPSS